MSKNEMSNNEKIVELLFLQLVNVGIDLDQILLGVRGQILAEHKRVDDDSDERLGSDQIDTVQCAQAQFVHKVLAFVEERVRREDLVEQRFVVIAAHF